MSWGAIKHAVNSTLGTGEFESLDRIAAKEFNSILYQKRIVEPH